MNSKTVGVFYQSDMYTYVIQGIPSMTQEVWTTNWNDWQQNFFGNALNERTLVLPLRFFHQHDDQLEGLWESLEKTMLHLKCSNKLDSLQSMPISESNTKMVKKQTLLKHYKFPEKAHCFKHLLMGINQRCFPLIIKASKKPLPKRGNISKTRSNFIGVTKNASHWQALISVWRRKTYIGTYKSELEAAVAFDFICILLHKLSAKTNFSYSKDDILDMLYNYDRNDQVLVPSQLSLSTVIQPFYV